MELHIWDGNERPGRERPSVLNGYTAKEYIFADLAIYISFCEDMTCFFHISCILYMIQFAYSPLLQQISDGYCGRIRKFFVSAVDFLRLLRYDSQILYFRSSLLLISTVYLIFLLPYRTPLSIIYRKKSIFTLPIP